MFRASSYGSVLYLIAFGVAQGGFAAGKENQKAKISEPGRGPDWKGICAARQPADLQHHRGLAPIKTIVNDPIVNDSIPNDSIVNDSILERRRKLATTQNLRGAPRNGTLVVQCHLPMFWRRFLGGRP
jgi:hypothetical protein